MLIRQHGIVEQAVGLMSGVWGRGLGRYNFGRHWPIVGCLKPCDWRR